MNGGTFLAILALQICLDRHGFSSNSLDGQSGAKTAAALAAYCESKGIEPPVPGGEAQAFLRYFSGEHDLFTEETVTAADMAALVRIPEDPAGKARLPNMGYESIREMFAERGHVTPHTLSRLNPHIDWTKVGAGDRIRIPEVTPGATGAKAARVTISLSKFTVTALDRSGKPIAVFPCSIAKDKSKRPPPGDLKIVTKIPNPNYTYTPDHVSPGKKKERHIFQPGPNNPVGVVWLGLSLPGYGIHGTPTPERIGRAESHGCFRLANWNAERLYELVEPGTVVSIAP